MDLKPPDNVAAAARKGLELRQSVSDSAKGGTEVGVARARDLANRKELSPDTIRRMVSFFARHEVDKQGKGFNKGEEGYPSKGRIAWELWGGDPGKAWAERVSKQLDKKESTVNDMNLLVDAEIRRIDGKHGKILAATDAQVKVEWADGTVALYTPGDADLAEDTELQTVNEGWVQTGTVLAEGFEKDGSDDLQTEEAVKTAKELMSEMRLLSRRMVELEPFRSRLTEASAKAKATLAAKKKAAAAKEAEKKASKPKKGSKPKKKGAKLPGPHAPNGTNPFYRYKTLGKNSPKKVQRKKQNRWKCSGSEELQTCVALKDIPSQGIKKGQEKKIKMWPKKAEYTKDYQQGRRSGKYKLPDGKKRPVAIKFYRPSGSVEPVSSKSA